MGMQVIFANNQCIVAGTGAAMTIVSDPVALRGNDRMTAVINIHGIFSAAAPGLAWYMDVSNDGTTWLPSFATGDNNAAGAEGWVVNNITYAFLRVGFTLQGSGGVGGAMYDMHATFDKAGA